MWWRNYKEIREFMVMLCDRMAMLEKKYDFLINQQGSGISNARAIEIGLNNIQEVMHDFFSSEDENNSINRIHDKLDTLLNDGAREEKVRLALKTLDKFEDYMKNVDKLNAMVNEFKGCISMARATMTDKKEMDQLRTKLENMIGTCQKYYTTHEQNRKSNAKIDAIHAAICSFQEKKARKLRKTVKKTEASPEA
jgi:hypothetical protein